MLDCVRGLCHSSAGRCRGCPGCCPGLRCTVVGIDEKRLLLGSDRERLTFSVGDTMCCLSTRLFSFGKPPMTAPWIENETSSLLSSCAFCGTLVSGKIGTKTSIGGHSIGAPVLLLESFLRAKLSRGLKSQPGLWNAS